MRLTRLSAKSLMAQFTLPRRPQDSPVSRIARAFSSDDSTPRVITLQWKIRSLFLCAVSKISTAPTGFRLPAAGENPGITFARVDLYLPCLQSRGQTPRAGSREPRKPDLLSSSDKTRDHD